MNIGIDYGLGKTNVDTETGIRYGIIPQNDVLQAWADSSKPYYGEPHCPKCGNAATAGDSEVIQSESGTMTVVQHPEHTEEWECDGCGDFRCEQCEYLFDGDQAYGDEPLSYYIDDGEYLAESDSHGDIMIIRSPYYTHAQFCSPCAPGAGYLRNPVTGGPKTYCFGPDWFDDYCPCPYPIYRVDNGECVYTPENNDP